jgi:hypothetical protein
VERDISSVGTRGCLKSRAAASQLRLHQEPLAIAPAKDQEWFATVFGLDNQDSLSFPSQSERVPAAGRRTR